jgi:hypothetical protein
MMDFMADGPLFVCAVAQPAQQVGAGLMVVVIAGQPALQTVNGGECHLGTSASADRDGLLAATSGEKSRRTTGRRVRRPPASRCRPVGGLRSVSCLGPRIRGAAAIFPGSVLPGDTAIQLYRRTAIGISGAWELAVGTRLRTETRSRVTGRVITERRVVSRYSGTFRGVKGDVDTRDVLAAALLRSSIGSPASRGQAGRPIDSRCSSGRSRFSARDCSLVAGFSPSILCEGGGDLFVEYNAVMAPESRVTTSGVKTCH